MAISPVPELIAELADGRMVILVDEEDRENEGDLVLAAEHVTPEAINFMARFGRGLICLTLTRERCEYLKLPAGLVGAANAQGRHGRVVHHQAGRPVALQLGQGVGQGKSPTAIRWAW